MAVSNNRGGPPKLDGENHGIFPINPWMIWGNKTHYFRVDTHIVFFSQPFEPLSTKNTFFFRPTPLFSSTKSPSSKALALALSHRALLSLSSAVEFPSDAMFVLTHGTC